MEQQVSVRLLNEQGGLNNLSDDDMKKKSEQAHFDQWEGEGRSSEVIFYDTPFIQELLAEIENFAMNNLGDMTGKKVLFYGCGVNSTPAKIFLERGAASVYMIDISPKSIELLNSRIGKEGLGSRLFPMVMDCEKLNFEDNGMDVVYGRAILHHLDIKIALSEIKRVLKNSGKAAFIEPLGMNPFINFYRKLTPHRRTPDEKPFDNNDFEIIHNSGFSMCKHDEFTFFTNVGIFLNTILKVPEKLSINYQNAKKIDDILLGKISFLRKFCWNTVITLTK